MTRAFVIVGSGLVAVALAACGDLKAATPDDPTERDGLPGANDDSGGALPAPSGSDGGGGSDATGAGDASSAATGPGPHGSLPSGYCCTADKDCRDRHCVDTGGGNRMCLDACANDLRCTRPDIAFTCDLAATPEKMCTPSASFACLPSATYVRGTALPGACCNATVAPNNDGTAGSACEGSICVAVGGSPLVCTHRCEFQGDCPGGYQCVMFGASKACVPSASGYTCK